jgi:four helix bundle protein
MGERAHVATVKRFEELGVWQDARQMVRSIYAASNTRVFSRDCSLRDQIRRAAISTMSNIAEGFERGTRNEFIRFLNIAKGSNGEVRSQLHVARDQGYINEDEFVKLCDSTVPLSRRLSSFIRYLESCPNNRRTKQKGSSR